MLANEAAVTQADPMTCPGCGAKVEEGAELCLECGEPIAPPPPIARPAAAAPGANVAGRPASARTAGAPASPPNPSLPRAGGAPPPIPSLARAAAPNAAAAPTNVKAASSVGAGAQGTNAAAGAAKAGVKAVKRPYREEEPEPVRCPNCGGKTRAARCPGCGMRLRSDDDD